MTAVEANLTNLRVEQSSILSLMLKLACNIKVWVSHGSGSGSSIVGLVTILTATRQKNYVLNILNLKTNVFSAG